ncbi:MAG: class I SAM-dependent methyltransferase [Eudoraea sp.]|nr:class I SAM-dependent methyltransferase [Eudoraea sp.]NNK31144.1 class I SAM-dependent methyltransferase [Flavobacteriaceae bacterium]
MNKSILNTGVQSFIRNFLSDDILSVALKKSPFSNVSSQELAQQIASRSKCEHKLPDWFQNEGIYYPDKLHIEQASSEQTAEYKAGMVHGNSLADLTGGMGVDSYYFSQRMARVYYFETKAELAEISAHNLKVLGADNIDICSGDGVARLKNNTRVYDWIYLDPSRRAENNRRVFRLEEGFPNVLEILPLLFSKADNILLKTAPMLDIHEGLRVLQQVVSIHVVAVRNEVKELLWILGKSAKSEADIVAINLGSEQEEPFVFTLAEEQACESIYSPPQEYLYEPNAALLKAGAFKSIGVRTGLAKLHPHSHLYTGHEAMPFPGRRFKVEAVHPYSKKMPFKKANITTRNFPISVAALRKKHRISDGGNSYIFFTKTIKEQLVVIECVKF